MHIIITLYSFLLVVSTDCKLYAVATAVFCTICLCLGFSSLCPSLLPYHRVQAQLMLILFSGPTSAGFDQYLAHYLKRFLYYVALIPAKIGFWAEWLFWLVTAYSLDSKRPQWRILFGFASVSSTACCMCSINPLKPFFTAAGKVQGLKACLADMNSWVWP